jgi:hypothetical protein
VQTASGHDAKASSVDRVRYAAKQPADLGVGERSGQPLLSRQMSRQSNEGIHGGFRTPTIGACGPDGAGWKVVAPRRRSIKSPLGDTDTARLRSIAQSRTEPSRVERARILLPYREDPSFFAVGRALGLHHQTVQRCVERALAEGPMAALDDCPRPGREPTITLEAKAWLVSLACRKAISAIPTKTARLAARHAREHGPAQELANPARGTVCKLDKAA